jgi:hypothetical protein
LCKEGVWGEKKEDEQVALEGEGDKGDVLKLRFDDEKGW